MREFAEPKLLLIALRRRWRLGVVTGLVVWIPLILLLYSKAPRYRAEVVLVFTDGGRKLVSKGLRSLLPADAAVGFSQ